jgi:hypothetical protein
MNKLSELKDEILLNVKVFKKGRVILSVLRIERTTNLYPLVKDWLPLALSSTSIVKSDVFPLTSPLTLTLQVILFCSKLIPENSILSGEILSELRRARSMPFVLISVGPRNL